MSLLYLILGILALIFLWLIFTFNGLIRKDNRLKEAWADIEVQLKRRYDLIPNLVEIVKGYASHERQTFEKVIAARSQAMASTNPKEKLEAENALSQTLKSLFALAENYPDLKANQNFLELQRELTDTEDKIQAARRFYNANVRDYNIFIQSFPNNLVAPIFGFRRKELFEIEEPAEKEAPKIQF